MSSTQENGHIQFSDELRLVTNDLKRQEGLHGGIEAWLREDPDGYTLSVLDTLTRYKVPLDAGIDGLLNMSNVAKQRLEEELEDLHMQINSKRIDFFKSIIKSFFGGK